jgi:hypothetical protein
MLMSDALLEWTLKALVESVEQSDARVRGFARIGNTIGFVALRAGFDNALQGGVGGKARSEVMRGSPSCFWWPWRLFSDCLVIADCMVRERGGIAMPYRRARPPGSFRKRDASSAHYEKI